MKVQFEFSTADLAEVARRTVDRSPLVRRWRARNVVAGGVLCALLAFAFTPGDLTMRLASGLLIAPAIFAITVYLFSRRNGRTRIKAFYRESLGGDGPFMCEVELTPAGVVSRQLGQELHHAWSHVASVDEIPGGIEFVYKPIGSLLVRDRAFSDSTVRADFLSLARSQARLDTSKS